MLKSISLSVAPVLPCHVSVPLQELPKEALYMPSLMLRVVDHRAFGSKPVVATAVVSDLQHYTVEPKAAK